MFGIGSLLSLSILTASRPLIVFLLLAGWSSGAFGEQPSLKLEPQDFFFACNEMRGLPTPGAHDVVRAVCGAAESVLEVDDLLQTGVVAANIHGRMSPGSRRLWVSFPSFYVETYKIERLILAIDKAVADNLKEAVAVVDLDLPGLAPEICDPRNPPGLKDVTFERSYILRFNGVRPDSGGVLCRLGKDADRPWFQFRSVRLKGALRIELPPLAPLSISLVASTFEGSVDILRTGSLSDKYNNAELASSPSVEVDPARAGWLFVQGSKFESGFSVHNLSFGGAKIYFNEFRTVALFGPTFKTQFELRDNSIGPLRFSRIRLPSGARIDSNQIKDSFFLEEIEVVPTRSDTSVDADLALLHNRIDGNLVLLLDKDTETPRSEGERSEQGVSAASLREGLPTLIRLVGQRVGGSAYLDVRGPDDKRSTRPPVTLDLSDTEIRTRLVASLVKRVETHRDGSKEVVTRRLAASSTEARNFAQSLDRRLLSVKLSNVSVGTLTWNLPFPPRRNAATVPYVWYGAGFRFQHFEPDLDRKAVDQEKQSADSRPARPELDRDERREPDELTSFLHSYVGDSPEPLEWAESYLRGKGFIFAPQTIRAKKIETNIAFESDKEFWSKLGDYGQSYLAPWLTTGGAVAHDPARAADGVAREEPAGVTIWQLIEGSLKYLALNVTDFWGWPADHGAAPGYALLLWAFVFTLGSGAYWLHGRRWKGKWSETPAGATTPPFRRETIPGFVLREEHPWRAFHPLKYSADCMIPLINLEMKQNYRVYHESWTKDPIGSFVSIVPWLQTAAGWWLGTLLVGLLLI